MTTQVTFTQPAMTLITFIDYILSIIIYQSQVVFNNQSKILVTCEVRHDLSLNESIFVGL